MHPILKTVILPLGASMALAVAVSPQAPGEGRAGTEFQLGLLQCHYDSVLEECAPIDCEGECVEVTQTVSGIAMRACECTGIRAGARASGGDSGNWKIWEHAYAVDLGTGKSWFCCPSDCPYAN